MSPQTLVVLGLKAGIVLLVFSLGLGSRLSDAAFLFRRPALLVRSVLSMYLILPLFALIIAVVFSLHPAVKIALVALSVSPVPPLLPRKTFRAGGEVSYIISLLVTVTLFSIVFVPLAMKMLELVFARPLHMAPLAIARLVFVTLLLPLLAGMLVNRLKPVLASRVVGPIALVANVLLVAAAFPTLYIVGSGMISLIGTGALITFIAFVGVGLTTGHIAGGPNPEDRATLALFTASRHPGVAIAIALGNFPEQKLALAAILLYLLVSTVIATPYLLWSRRHLKRIEGG